MTAREGECVTPTSGRVPTSRNLKTLAKETLGIALALVVIGVVGGRSRVPVESAVVQEVSWSERDGVVAYSLRVINRSNVEMTVTIDLLAVRATASTGEPDLGRAQLAVVLRPAEEKTYFGLLPLIDAGSSSLTVSKHCVRHEQPPLAYGVRPSGPRSSS